MKTKPQKPIHIFAAGKRTASDGSVYEFTEAMLAATAAAYDPKLHEAPFVKGHPKNDDPAFGWAASLVASAGALLAVPRQVEPVFAEDVKAGRWKKRSAAFYAPTHPSNPVPGVYYLKHIGFLGALPPAVKGLPDAEFSEAEEGLLMFAEDIGVAEFAEWDDVDNANLWRRLRDWFIGEKGLEVADQIVPAYLVKSLEQGAQDELREAQQESNAAVGVTAQFSEKGSEMSAEKEARLLALEAENKALKDKQVEFAEAEKKRKAGALHTENVNFAEGLIKEGKLLPVDKDLTVATLDFMSAQEQVLEFGEGDAKKSLLDAHKAKLLASPKLVEFSELAGGKGAVSSLDVEDASALAAKAVEFQEAEAKDGRTINIAQAVQHISKQHGDKQS
ncbi:MAG: hypothetical protein WC825_07675 [Gallionellaceae bacterium]